MDRSKLPLEPCHVGVPSGVSKMIYQPMVHSAQTKHVSCDKLNTISKRMETGFLLTHVTKEFHRVHPKCFLSLFHVQCKTSSLLHVQCKTVYLSCIEVNIVSKRTQMSFHLTHITKEYHWVCPKWFLSIWYVQRKPSTYLVLRLTLSLNGPIRASTWPASHRSTIE
jgi:hypothetical protein